jgi:hypothetical protein
MRESTIPTEILFIGILLGDERTLKFYVPFLEHTENNS